ncbi:hypothetical protein [Yoonia sp.]|uniref:hypothetical protein n=1 Tax=Yoonia sp. TaxID=2212373 RepID=UPI003F6AB09D
METTLNIATKPVAAHSHAARQIPQIEKEVTTVDPVPAVATLPADRIFVAQVVTARLSGAAFPENPGEIAPPERRLKPYDVPMLPFDKDTGDAAITDEQVI